MTHFERDFYEARAAAPPTGTPRWWDSSRELPGDRRRPATAPRDLCDAGTKTHINDDPAQYYDYAIGTVIKFQLHDHIAREILKQDPRECNYYGSKEVGEFLRDPRRWARPATGAQVIKEATGEPIWPRALMAYYAPLVASSRSATRERTARVDGAASRNRPTSPLVASAEAFDDDVKRFAALQPVCARERSTRSATWNGRPRRSRRSPAAKKRCRRTRRR